MLKAIHYGATGDLKLIHDATQVLVKEPDLADWEIAITRDIVTTLNDNRALIGRDGISRYLVLLGKLLALGEINRDGVNYVNEVADLPED